LTFAAGPGVLTERDQAMFMKESPYAHDRMRRRLVAHGEAGYVGSVVEDAKPEFLRRRPVGSGENSGRPRAAKNRRARLFAGQINAPAPTR
jgi:hypothetical protein